MKPIGLHLTAFVDVAGRPTHAVRGMEWTTSAAVVLPTARLNAVRTAIPRDFPKWGHCTEKEATWIVELIIREATAVAAVPINRDTPEWQQFVVDSKWFCEQMVVLEREQRRAELARRAADAIGQRAHSIARGTEPAEQRPVLGQIRAPTWAKPSTLLRYFLLAEAVIAGLMESLESHPVRPSSSRSLACVDLEIVADTDIGEEESIEVFKGFWYPEQIPSDSLASLGYQVSHSSVSLKTEQAEPLLLLPDYAAGLVHSTRLVEPGWGRMPLDASTSSRLLAGLGSKLKIRQRDFKESCRQVFSSQWDLAHAFQDEREAERLLPPS